MLPRTKVIIACIVMLAALIVVDQWRKNPSAEDTSASSQGSNASMQKVAVESQSESSGEWKEFSPQNNTFKVMLPALPQHASEAVPFPPGQGLTKYDMYFSQEKDGTTYMISMIQYPDTYNTSKADDVLSSAMNEMLAGSANNKLVTQQNSTFLNCPALDFAIQNNDITIRSKTFLMGKTLFVLTLSDRTSSLVDDLFKKFTDSFQLGDALKGDTKPEIPVPALPN